MLVPITMRQGITSLNLMANQYRMSELEKKKLTGMKNDVFSHIDKGIQNLKPNKWSLSRSADLIRGSLDKNTAMQGSSDIDVIYVMNFTPIKAENLPSPKEILLQLSSFIQNKYVITVNPRTITVKPKNNHHHFNSMIWGRNTLSMDIVPALVPINTKTNKPHWIYGISGSRNQGNWIKFSPKHQKEMADSLYINRKHPHDSPADLLVNLKKWRDDARHPPKKLPSYVLEILVYKDYKDFSDEGTLETRYTRILEKLSQIALIEVYFDKSAKPKGKKPVCGLGVIQDPANVSQNVISHFTDEEKDWWGRYAKTSRSGGFLLW